MYRRVPPCTAVYRIGKGAARLVAGLMRGAVFPEHLLCTNQQAIASIITTSVRLCAAVCYGDRRLSVYLELRDDRVCVVCTRHEMIVCVLGVTRRLCVCVETGDDCVCSVYKT